MDTRLKQLLVQITDTGIGCVSFDVFDTLIFRHVPLPATLFEKVPSQIEETQLARMPAGDFRLLREQAEKAARQHHSQYEDIQLEEIYQQLPFSAGIRQQLIEAELNAESQNFVINTDLVELIRELLERGIAVCLISDMYLSVQQISSTFFQNSVLYELPLFVSSEHRLTKSSGRLYQIVQQRMQWDYPNWLHVGDNKDADIDSAKALGIQTYYYHPALTCHFISRAETTLYEVSQVSSAVRLKAALEYHYSKSCEQIAYEMGAFVWGPILTAFADWVIDQTLSANAKYIVCLMREAYAFEPVIKQRLSQRNIKHIPVVRFYISRKAAFWPAIDINSSNWLQKTIDTLMTYRGYTLHNFIDDFRLDRELLNLLEPAMELNQIDSVFVQGEALYTRLCREAASNSRQLAEYIQQQRALLADYLRQQVGVRLSECAVVDFGNGGTIQHSMEQIYGEKAGANLLFYATKRIYRYINDSHFYSFISPATDKFRVAEMLARSPECIEALLVGTEGSTIEYTEQQGNVVAVTEQHSGSNDLLCEAFNKGINQYLLTLAQQQSKSPSFNDVTGLLARYLLLPTYEEAHLFETLVHQDNFGTSGEYPVISEQQKKVVEKEGLAEAMSLALCDKTWQMNVVHWPSAVIAVIDKYFLASRHLFIEGDNHYVASQLIQKIRAVNWNRVSVYGAGELFLSLEPLLTKNQIQIASLVDRKAELNQSLKVLNYPVRTLDSALETGSDQFVISSLAFKDEIKQKIFNAAKKAGVKHIRVISI